MARYRAYKNRTERLQRVAVIFIVIVVLATLIIGITIKTVIEPNLESVSEIRAEALVSKAVNESLAEQFKEREGTGDLFIRQTAEDGAVDMVQADSMKINVLMSELSIELHDVFNDMGREYYDVPLGALLGSKFLSQVGPEVEVAISPIGVSHMDFRTEFKSEGINQTKYKIYIELQCRVKVMAPFSSRVFNTTNTIPIAEAVILGEVPNSYVQVPKEDILDVTDE